MLASAIIAYFILREERRTHPELIQVLDGAKHEEI
jgi:hypothetical protein